MTLISENPSIIDGIAAVMDVIGEPRFATDSHGGKIDCAAEEAAEIGGDQSDYIFAREPIQNFIDAGMTVIGDRIHGGRRVVSGRHLGKEITVAEVDGGTITRVG